MCVKSKPSRILAMTLAEVLITLGVIGIVAAMTISTLINYTQKQEYTVALKKAYSEFNQALSQMAIANGCVNDLACTGLFSSSGTSHLTLGNELVKYFNVNKNCTTSVNQGCWSAITNMNYDGSYTGTNSTYDSYGAYTFITADGMSVYIQNYKNDCNTPTYSMGRTGNMTQTCGVVFIDVNGLKGPNNSGRDTFLYYITNGKGATLYPGGGADDAKTIGADSWWTNSSNAIRFCNPSSKNGYYCAGRVMEEGWQMNY